MKIWEEPIFDDTQTVRRSARIPKQAKRYVKHIDAGSQEVLSHLDDDPKTYEEAITSIDSEKWLEVMKSEMDSMYSN